MPPRFDDISRDLAAAAKRAELGPDRPRCECVIGAVVKRAALARRMRAWPFGPCVTCHTMPALDADGACLMHRPTVLSRQRERENATRFYDDGQPRPTLGAERELPLPDWHMIVPPDHAPCNGCPPLAHVLRRDEPPRVSLADRRCRICKCKMPHVIGGANQATSTCDLCVRFGRGRPLRVVTGNSNPPPRAPSPRDDFPWWRCPDCGRVSAFREQCEHCTKCGQSTASLADTQPCACGAIGRRVAWMIKA